MSIEWGKGSAFNLGRINDIRVERSRSDKGWTFLVSDNKRTYLHVDNRHFKTKEELDECIMGWINERKKM
jgi:hypothetical protein